MTQGQVCTELERFERMEKRLNHIDKRVEANRIELRGGDGRCGVYELLAKLQTQMKFFIWIAGATGCALIGVLVKILFFPAV